jgi:hypothetical protein
MSITAAIRKLIEQGFSVEDALAAAEVFEETAPVRSKGAIRTERWRNRKASQSVTRDASDVRDAPSDKEKSPTPPKEITSPYSPPKGGSYTPVDALAEVLDAEHAAAVIEHRQRLRKPLTAFAAKKLAAQLARWPDPNEAADAMLANGWQGFKPEWMESRSKPAATAPPRKPNAFDAYQQIANERGWNEPEILPGNHGNVERLPAEQRGPSGTVVDLRSGTDWRR